MDDSPLVSVASLYELVIKVTLQLLEQGWVLLYFLRRGAFVNGSERLLPVTVGSIQIVTKQQFFSKFLRCHMDDYTHSLPEINIDKPWAHPPTPH